MDKHTPGPWRIVGTRDDEIFIYAGPNDGGPVCEISQTTGWGHVDEANARLIAAAPDLYEACKAAAEKMQCFSKLTRRNREGCGHPSCTACNLAAAVAKAEEQSSG